MKQRAIGASLIAVVLLLLVSGSAMASPSARAIGMGGAFVAAVNDPTAASLNPAALTTLSGPQMTFDYGTGFLPNRTLIGPQAEPAEPWTLEYEGAPYIMPCTDTAPFPYLAFASPTSESGLAYALSVYRTSLYTFEPFVRGGTDEFGNPIPVPYEATIGQDTVVGYSLAFEILPGLSIGGTVRLGFYTTDRPWVKEDESIASYQHQFLHIGIDAGMLYRPVPQLALGIAINDLNQAKMEFLPPAGLKPSKIGQVFDQTIRFPYQLRWGAAFMLPPYLTLAADMTTIPQSFSEILDVMEVGGELRLNKMFALRGGSYHGTLTLGAGLGVPFQEAGVLNIDYAYVADTEGRHYLSASWLF